MPGRVRSDTHLPPRHDAADHVISLTLDEGCERRGVIARPRAGRAEEDLGPVCRGVYRLPAGEF